MCLYPKLIMNKKYISNKKNGGNAPMPTDIRTLYVPVGCGKCIECMKQKKRAWQIRMLEEIKTDKTGIFVTLTFSNEKLKELGEDVIKTNDEYIYNNQIATLAVRRFLERWRKKYKKSIKHFLITELGHQNTERIHLHGIIFTEHRDDIELIWGYGYVWLGTFVNEKTVNYIIKYISKVDLDHKNYKPKILCSKGIGKGYIESYNATRNRYNGENTKEYYTTRTGHQINLPIYYRNKIYSEDEREQLWLNKLDKETMYVCGEEVDISENTDEYEKLRDHYREKNKILGYGDDSETWDEKQYKYMRSKLNVKLKLK